MRSTFRRLTLLALLLAAPAARADGSLPFCAGERLTFDLAWGVIPAGGAVIEVLPPESAPGEPAGAEPGLHFRMRAWTNEFADVFYKVRDQVDSWTDPGLTRSLHYRKSQHEGRHHREILVRFFWNNSTVGYENDVNGPKEPILLMPGTFDPLSVFYAFRSMPLGPDSAALKPVTDGVKLVIGEARVLRRETVTVPAGTFEAWLVEPDLRHIGGVFRKSPGAKLKVWITADQRKIPVRIESRVLVGSFTAELSDLAWPEGCNAAPGPDSLPLAPAPE